MKFLADMGVSMTVVQALREQDYDAIHLREQQLQRLPDPTILIKVIKAKQENRIILTFDLDFSELLAMNRENLPSVLIFRLQKTTPHFVADRLLESLLLYKENLIQGAILIIEDSRYRLRHLPI
jgi:predicted nuclease of predicted toxin-antitoxin system